MIKLERDVYRQARSGEMTLQQLADYLLRTYPVYEIAMSLAETINFQEIKPIVISEEEFRTHFRIRGIKDNGEAELRGRPKSDSIVTLK